jgi:hypothetical protein
MSAADVRRIRDLFGLIAGAAQRYIDGLQHPDLRDPSAQYVNVGNGDR